MQAAEMEEGPLKEPLNMALHANRDTRYNNGTGGRVTLMLPRLDALVQANINSGKTNKNWIQIQQELFKAQTPAQVQQIINNNQINFTSNSVSGGTKKRRRRGGKRRQSRRR